MKAGGPGRLRGSGMQVADIVAYAVPLVLMGALTAVYWIAPEFYLTWILEVEAREGQFVEILTFLAAAAAAVMLLWAARQLWVMSRQRTDGRTNPDGSAILVGVAGLAVLFFAGEEVSWGQTWFQWETPGAYREGLDSVETNIHNAKGLPFSVQSLGSLYLIVMFIALPLVWAARHRLNARGIKLPQDWKQAVAEWPVVFCMVIAFAWKGMKDVYLSVNPDAESSVVYMQFIEQFNEHKEMLVAISIFIYAVYRIRMVRRCVSPSTAASPPARMSTTPSG